MDDINFDYEKIYLGLKNKTYKHIGSGSGRQVFDLGNGYVVKYAKNKKGYVQNKVEHSIASDNHTNILAKIPTVSEDFRFLIMEKAEKIKDIKEVWAYFNVKNNKELFALEQIKNLSTKYDLLLQDFGRPVNWGRIKGKPVIIDYGFTWNVRKKYYIYFIKL